MEIKTAIVEDDPDMLNYLKELVQDIPELALVAIASSVKNALPKIRKTSPELLLLDIRLKDGNAFEILNALETETFQVIFITGFDEYMQQAFDYFAFSYISKPFSKDQFNKVISSYIRRRTNYIDRLTMKILGDFIMPKGTRFLLHVGNEYVAIDLKEVVYCKTDGNYTQFYLANGNRLLATHALKFYEKLFHDKGFFRINRFYLINLEQIRSIFRKETIIMNDGEKINISARNRRKLSDLIETINRP